MRKEELPVFAVLVDQDTIGIGMTADEYAELRRIAASSEEPLMRKLAGLPDYWKLIEQEAEEMAAEMGFSSFDELVKSLEEEESPLSKDDTEVMYEKIVAKLKAAGVWEDEPEETAQGSQG